MSQAVSASTGKAYTMRRVCRVWRIPRSTVYHRLQQSKQCSSRPRGPKAFYSDAELVAHIKDLLEQSPFHGEGYRKIWARLRLQDIRTSPRRVLRVMREDNLLVFQNTSIHPGPKAHDGTITQESSHVMWGTDMTKAYTIRDGWVSVFGAVDHFSAACMGLHAAKPGTRCEAVEPVRQGVREAFGAIEQHMAQGITMRHDCGSQYLSKVFQDELRFLGFTISPAFVRSPQCNGCIERFFRTLKENLLWVRSFQDIEELSQALQEFKEQYNTQWLIGRHGYQTPYQVLASHRPQQGLAA